LFYIKNQVNLILLYLKNIIDSKIDQVMNYEANFFR